MVDYSGPDLGLRAAQMPTLLDEIHRKTIQRAQISQTTRAEDAAQRTQRAYQMLEGIDEQPSTGYGSLFGQRASPQNEFRTVDDAAAYLRATDPEGMQTRQAALGDFMANQALPRLTSVPDPAQRVAVLKQMAASGPPMLNRLVRDIAADGVITDEELAQAEGMFGTYRKAVPYVNLGQQGVFDPTKGEIVAGTARQQSEVPTSAQELDWAFQNPDNPAAQAIIAKDRADRDRIERANRGPVGGGGGAPRAARTSWQTINGRRVLMNDDTGEIIRDIGEAGSAKGGNLEGTAGGLENRFYESMVSSANSALIELRNIMEMPATANAGIFGLGSQPGESVVRSGIDALRNKLGTDEVQNYSQQVANMARSLTYLETGGRATNESAIEELRRILVIREGDNGFVVLQRLATVTQLIEKYLEPKLRNPRLGAEQKEFIRELIRDAKAAVPWTVSDVTQFQRGGGRVPVKPGESFIEWARRSMGNRASGRPALDTTNPFTQPLGTPSAPLNIRPAAPAPAGGNPTVDWNDL